MIRKGRYKEAHARANARPVQDHSLSAKRPQYRLGVDVGGTHTDLVLLDSDAGELLVEKVASTPKNPAFGFWTASPGSSRAASIRGTLRFSGMARRSPPMRCSRCGAPKLAS